jgi:crotonobetainyl-CoA:carnitine CoA-transferase CaiB-like acyl-CoA transferase
MKDVQDALGLNKPAEIVGDERLPSCFAVTDLAAASIGAVAGAAAQLAVDLGLSRQSRRFKVDGRLASLWFARSIYPIGWNIAPTWDAIAGDYEGKDGWIKLHTNLEHHRAAALRVLKCEEDRDAVAAAVGKWDVQALESAIHENGGAAAAMRSVREWQDHPQGKAVAAEPLIIWSDAPSAKNRNWQRHVVPSRPLQGVRVLDLTRVLAGPVATRTLAGLGASVLRIDPAGWDEPNVVPDVTLGKRCSHLDLRNDHDRAIFETLLAQADVLVHGYRPGALEGLGYGEAERERLAPGIAEVSLDAYGWTGPWADRRGFDSLVQMSCGIAEAGMHWAENNRPTPLPVQALDHATGYLMAAAVIRALSSTITGEGSRKARLSLARTAELLVQYEQKEPGRIDMQPRPSDFLDEIEQTPWGPAHRLKPPFEIEDVRIGWSSPACNLGSSRSEWN